MLGLMMDRPLLLSGIIEHAARVHAPVRVISHRADGTFHSYTYADAGRRVRQLASALVQLGLRPGDRVATIAWNSYYHFELYYAVPCVGQICHTINPRMSAEQLVYAINHAEDRVIFIEADLLPNLAAIIDRIPSVTDIVVLGGQVSLDTETTKQLWAYDTLLATGQSGFVWPDMDERTAASLCYTAGTTGVPKGVLYSHRSAVLHAMSICRTDTWAVSGDDVICPIVPMFHVHAWGLPHAAPLCGATLILPGPHLSSREICEMLEMHKVTLAFAVPTIWHGVVEHCRSSGFRFSHLARAVISGSSISTALLTELEERHGLNVLQAWGMTESSPMGLVGRVPYSSPGRPLAEDRLLRLKQGRPVFGTEARVLDDAGEDVPPDDETRGELVIRGPWVVSSYYRDDNRSHGAFVDGWFRTGDIATMDYLGFIRVVDRRKDAIKSGGEWISSIELEDAALDCQDIISAAAVAIPNEKWGERPVLAVVVKAGTEIGVIDRVMDAMRVRMPKWTLPDAIFILERMPYSAAGKILKDEVRQMIRTAGKAS